MSVSIRIFNVKINLFAGADENSAVAAENPAVAHGNSAVDDMFAQVQADLAKHREKEKREADKREQEKRDAEKKNCVERAAACCHKPCPS